MSNLVLIDTSSWIQALRRNGDVEIRQRVENLLGDDAAAWCEMVRLELWRGVRGAAEQQRLIAMDQSIRRIPINTDVWQASCDLGLRARRAGLQIPSPDILIFACAQTHGIPLEHADRHYDLLAAMK